MWKYLRFGYFHWLWLVVAMGGLLAGGAWMWAGVVYLFVVGVGGEVVSKNRVDKSNPDYKYGIIHDLILYSVGLGLYVSLFTLAWTCAGEDILGFGAWVNGLLAQMGISYDVVAARSTDVWYDYLGGCLSVGGLLGVSGITAAHELTHRTANPFDMWVGRWIFASSFGSNFATEHVYGHHKRLGFPDDPVTPKRGIGFYEFLTVGGWRQFKGGIGVEKRRLAALGKSPWSIQNRILHAWMRGYVVLVAIYLVGGWAAIGAWFVAIMCSKYILEGLNFFSHYGMVRAPGEKIAIRHTFSSANPLTNHFTFNLGRHGAHHVYDREYHLLPYKEMPECPYGYLTMTAISWVPPLFLKIMVPLLKDWEENWATAEERAIAEEHDKESGIPALMGGASSSPTPSPA
jgi:alkane 1-monooxygenase